MIAETTGTTTLVASRRPPRPTSSTAVSTRACRNNSKATAVVTSKNVGWAWSTPSRRSVDRVAHAGHGRVQRLRFDRPAVDDEPLAKIDQVRRRVASRAVAGRAERRIDHRRDGAFAVRAGDVNRPERALRMAEAVDDREDVVEAELDPELFEAEEIGKRIRHLI